MTLKNKTRFLFIIFAICILLSTSNLTSRSNQAIIPLNITVQGKLIITDALTDNKAGTDPTINVLLRLTPDLNSSVVTGSSAIRIRTNLNNWKLTALRRELANPSTNIDLKDISLSFTTQAGSSANPNCGKLLPPFDQITDISKISNLSPTEIFAGSGKTSVAKDPENKNNWFQLTSSYSIAPDFLYEIGEWSTTITYNLVSP